MQSLSNKLSDAFSSLSGRNKISEKDLDAALKKIEVALLEADVSATIVKKFIEDCQVEYAAVRTKKSLPAAATVYGKVKDRLVMYLGGDEHPSIEDKTILMVGTQGSGKTTTAAKLAFKLAREDLRVLTVSLDTSRPAAMEQLKIMSQKAGVDFFEDCLKMEDPVEIAKAVLDYRDKHNYDSLIVDTAGRLHVDSTMMRQLEAISKVVEPTETLLVADSMLGNDSVRIAREFSDKMSVDGIIMSRFDSNARGGAAISMRYVSGVPIKYVGIGEGVEDLDLFIPKVAASRIIGGDSEIDRLASQYQKLSDGTTSSDGNFSMQDFIHYIDRLNRSSLVMDMTMEIIKRTGAKPDEGKTEEAQEKMKEMFQSFREIYSAMKPEEHANPTMLKVSSARRMRIQKSTGYTYKDVKRMLEMYDAFRKEQMVKQEKTTFQNFKEQISTFLSSSASKMFSGRR